MTKLRSVWVVVKGFDLYAKCGCIEMALQTFNEMPCGNIVTLDALLIGVAME